MIRRCLRCKKRIISFEKYGGCKKCLKVLDQILADKLEELKERYSS